MVSIPDYKAPAIAKFVTKPVKATKLADQETQPKKNENKTVLKIRVLNEQVEQVRSILKQFNFIEVL